MRTIVRENLSQGNATKTQGVENMNYIQVFGVSLMFVMVARFQIVWVIVFGMR
jgi:hypothetical protein